MELAKWTTAMNLCSAVCIVAGVRFARTGRRDAHRRAMLLATGFSALFFALYLARVALEGTHRFPGTGAARTVYLIVLASHSLLAAAVPPLVIVSLYRALRGQYAAHRRIVRWTVPIWLYVSLTGPLIYVMLYHWH